MSVNVALSCRTEDTYATTVTARRHDMIPVLTLHPIWLVTAGNGDDASHERNMSHTPKGVLCRFEGRTIAIVSNYALQSPRMLIDNTVAPPPWICR
jgi:hypothetical protein